MKLSVGLQIYSVRDDAEKDLRGTLEKVKAMGYEGVELAGLYGHKPSEVKAMLDEIGLVPVSAHVPLEDMLEDPEGVIGDYVDMGFKFIAVPHLHEEQRPGTSGFAQTIKDIESVAIVAKDLGIQMLYHNHDFEFVKVDGEYGLDILYDSISEDLLKTEIDTCWVNVAGEDPVEYVKKYSGRAPVVHLKDFVMSGKEKPDQLYVLIGTESEEKQEKKESGEEAFGFRPVGYGVQDFPPILKASEEAGAQWVIVEQDQPALEKTSLECAQMSREYLKKIGL
ncbi:MAG TPA: sugar phosphate isomerase/epimerase [Clostridia bacterium]|nr:sugar phosphate isomerase/epimerase [Clostridia bacterium]